MFDIENICCYCEQPKGKAGEPGGQRVGRDQKKALSVFGFLLSARTSPVSGHVRSHFHKTAAAAGALAAAALLVTAPPASAVGSRDVTADVLADRDVTLTGDTVVTVPAGTTTYDGVFRGEGTLTVRGSGTLILTRDSDFTLPKSLQRQSVRTPGGNHPYVTTTRPDPPAITVMRGATLQYGNGGTTGLIGHFPYNTPAFRLNQDNIRVDGTLRLALKSAYNLGAVSGSGLITQPRFLWGTWDLTSGPFSGVIDNGTQANAGRPEYATSLPGVRKVLNQGTWTVDTPLGRTVTQRMDFYQREYGSDINVQSRPGGKVVLTGQYSWSNQGGDTDPHQRPRPELDACHQARQQARHQHQGRERPVGRRDDQQDLHAGHGEDGVHQPAGGALPFPADLRLQRAGDPGRPHRRWPLPRHPVRARRG